jgi:hypothetical protein
MGTYEDTLYGDNVQLAAQEEFDVVSTGSSTRITFTFDEQPDGEYLLVASPGDEGGTINFWAKSNATDFHTRTYIDDTEVEDWAISNVLHYTKTPNNLWGPIMDSGL